jgi:hypothetical protein
MIRQRDDFCSISPKFGEDNAKIDNVVDLPSILCRGVSDANEIIQKFLTQEAAGEQPLPPLEFQ